MKRPEAPPKLGGRDHDGGIKWMIATEHRAVAVNMSAGVTGFCVASASQCQ